MATKKSSKDDSAKEKGRETKKDHKAPTTAKAAAKPKAAASKATATEKATATKKTVATRKAVATKKAATIPVRLMKAGVSFGARAVLSDQGDYLGDEIVYVLCHPPGWISPGEIKNRIKDEFGDDYLVSFVRDACNRLYRAGRIQCQNNLYSCDCSSRG